MRIVFISLYLSGNPLKGQLVKPQGKETMRIIFTSLYLNGGWLKSELVQPYSWRPTIRIVLIALHSLTRINQRYISMTGQLIKPSSWNATMMVVFKSLFK